MQHDALSVIAERTSVRKYTGEPVSEKQLELLLRAAMSAPSSKNKQPWHFIVLSGRGALQNLAGRLPYAKMLESAPVAIIVCGDTTVHTGDAAISWVMDCSAATENMLIAAQALGLGAVWTGVYPYADRIEAVGKAVNLPPEIIPLNVIAIGHPEKIAAPREKWNPERIHHEQFQQEKR